MRIWSIKKRTFHIEEYIIMIPIAPIPYKITEQEREVAHKLLDQLIDSGLVSNTIMWEQMWVDNLKPHRTRFIISATINNIE